MSYGIYRPGTSFAHKLDARSKIVFVLVYLVAAFVAQTEAMRAALLVVAVAALALSGASAKDALRMLRPFWWLMLFALVWNLLVNPTPAGAAAAARIVVQFVCLVWGTGFLMATTSATSLSHALRWLLTPFAHLGLKIENIALACGITFRFVPTLAEELQRVKAAQASRGARFDEGNAAARLKALVPALVPLFARSLRRADMLAQAIEARGFDALGTTARTHLSTNRLQLADGVVLVCAAVLLVCAIAL